jgi:hypothetical protein
MTASEYIQVELQRLDGKLKSIRGIPGSDEDETLKRLVKITLGEIDGLLEAKVALRFPK